MNATAQLARGVYKAGWQGPAGEIVLLAVTSSGYLLGGAPITVPFGIDHCHFADALWEWLDREDPQAEETPAREPQSPKLTLVRSESAPKRSLRISRAARSSRQNRAQLSIV